ncbi:hypothetical protein HK097_003314 [Rhizophlyctis rosea]|uniref:WD repeat-containing protein 55 homolog n=1 Tax=Rhizophlyctis rosea TaxID=64517 RepID=A0AAD5S3G4_9FUNG|nr:hypothetical protein HK097_003314 [Rhizophlyctis rosea]
MAYPTRNSNLTGLPTNAPLKPGDEPDPRRLISNDIKAGPGATGAYPAPTMRTSREPLAGGVRGSRENLGVSQSIAGSYSALSESGFDSRSGIGKKGKLMGSFGNLHRKEPVINGMLRSRMIREEDSEIYTVKFSPDDEYVAVGCGNAKIQVYSTRANDLAQTLSSPADTKVPCTCICFRPDASVYRNRNVLAASFADGKLIHYHYTSGQLISVIDEDENQINCVSYSADGKQFVTGGSDMHLRIYDGVTQKETLKMFTGRGDTTAGHSSKIFAVKFHPKDPKFLISAGWDNTIQMWDQRARCSIRSIYRPFICGDSLDFDSSGDRILSGSYLKEDPLQIWSWQTGHLIQTVPWSILENEKRHCLLYSAQFSKGPSEENKNRFIVAGGGGPNNEIKVFDARNGRAVGMVTNLANAVFSVAISHNDSMIALGGGGKTLYLYDVDTATNVTDFVY